MNNKLNFCNLAMAAARMGAPLPPAGTDINARCSLQHDWFLLSMRAIGPDFHLPKFSFYILFLIIFLYSRFDEYRENIFNPQFLRSMFYILTLSTKLVNLEWKIDNPIIFLGNGVPPMPAQGINLSMITYSTCTGLNLSNMHEIISKKHDYSYITVICTKLFILF